MRTLYFSGKLQRPQDLRKALEKRGIAVETRTIRYHLTNLEKSGDARVSAIRSCAHRKGNWGKRRCCLYSIVWGLAMETERLSLDCDYPAAAKPGDYHGEYAPGGGAGHDQGY
ncbi:hypothetical protein [Aminivibrio sp.]|uniref:hypothetical protein n=1 Tax=Aminivibrio sp. TaxID=1872489 RepID=UPI00345EA296